MLIMDFNKVKDNYDNNGWTKDMVKGAVVMNKITVDEYKIITGEDYVV